MAIALYAGSETGATTDVWSGNGYAVAALDMWDAYAFPPVGRDSQRRKEYRSEHGFRAEHPEEEGLSAPELRCFLRLVAEDRWFIERFGEVRFAIQVSRRRTRTACCSYRAATGFTLKFPDDPFNTRLVALHELAHIVTHRQKHGPVFCSVLLQLVIQYMGWVAGHALLRQYKINGVQLCG